MVPSWNQTRKCCAFVKVGVRHAVEIVKVRVSLQGMNVSQHNVLVSEEKGKRENILDISSSYLNWSNHESLRNYLQADRLLLFHLQPGEIHHLGMAVGCKYYNTQKKPVRDVNQWLQI